MDHRSHYITEGQRRLIAERNRPLRPKTCQYCGWPASLAEICMTCCDIMESIWAHKGLMQAHKDWVRQRVERQMGLL